MKLSLTIIAITFALTNLPAFAEEWDMQPEVAPHQASGKMHLPVAQVIRVAPVSPPNRMQFDLASTQPKNVEVEDAASETEDTKYAVAEAAEPELPKKDKTGSQTPSGLPQCCTAVLGLSGSDSGKGLPQCSLARLSKN